MLSLRNFSANRGLGAFYSSSKDPTNNRKIQLKLEQNRNVVSALMPSGLGGGVTSHGAKRRQAALF